MIKNGDLTLDLAHPMMSGLELLQAMENFYSTYGLDTKIVKQTVKGNFGVDLGKYFNPFAMEGVNKAPGEAAPEHFRSTGIREGDGEPAYEHGKHWCNPNGERWNKYSVECFANVWDHEPGYDEQHHCIAGPGGCVRAHDVNEAARPKNDDGSIRCHEWDAGKPNCDSALYGSIDNLRKTFGTPPGDDATISDTDWKALWLDSKYPPHFTPGHVFQQHH
jgi:hypothetical protein